VTEEIGEWLIKAYDYERPRRGQIRQGMILEVQERGITVDVGLKRDGFVPYTDVERLGKDTAAQLEAGQEVVAFVVRPEDQNGNLILSLHQAQVEQDWTRGQELLESGKIWRGKINGYNRGGLTLKFGRVYAFVPGSHIWALNNRHLSPDQREAKFQAYVGQELPLKVIEVDRKKRRLILSERLARQQLRQQHRQRLLKELAEGQVCRGVVTKLCDFGAFVDLGGADGLIHFSELAWRRVQHPGEVLQVGDEIEVYVLRLDHERQRIGLSLKHLQPDPWDLVDLNYTEGQLVSGVVSHVAKFGAFAALDIGVEGLIHISELADPPPQEPQAVVQQGDELLLRITRIESSRRRIGLSLKRVSEQERDEWLADSQRGENRR
jgi:small subunit ribosomal protein S1